MSDLADVKEEVTGDTPNGEPGADTPEALREIRRDDGNDEEIGPADEVDAPATEVADDETGTVGEVASDGASADATEEAVAEEAVAEEAVAEEAAADDGSAEIVPDPAPEEALSEVIADLGPDIAPDLPDTAEIAEVAADLPADAETVDAPVDAETTDSTPDVEIADVPPECVTDEDCDRSGDVPCVLRTVCDGGSCTSWAPVLGAPCDDGDACTLGDHCADDPLSPGSLTCAAGNPRDCSDDSACTADSCDPASGACLHEVLEVTCVNDNQCEHDCEDALACDGTWTCETGFCQPTEPVVCDPAADVGCLESRCVEPGGTCALVPIQSACDDGDFCTHDACDSLTGECFSEAYCGDNAPCEEATGPGSADSATTECVCTIDDYCCVDRWDIVCVAIADSECGSDCPTHAGSCEGVCGDTPDATCYCDASCFEYDDCCDDVCDACSFGDPDPCAAP